MSARLDELITDLGAELRPVRRLPPPLLRAALWLSLVLAAAAGFSCFVDLRPIAARLGSAPDMWLAVVGSALTMLLAAVATFQLSVPDRSPTWALLPIPGLLLWIGASGLGCLRTWGIPGVDPADMRETGHCFTFIVSLSIPLSVALVLMVRRACPLRPNLTAAVGGLAAAAAAATLLVFLHPFDAGATDLAVHAATVALVIILNRAFGGRLLAPQPIPRPSRP